MIKNAGCTLDIYAAKDSWVLANNSYDTWIEAPEDAGALLKHLLQFLANHVEEYDWVIPGDDIVVRQLNEVIMDDALFYKVMPLTKIENRAVLGSKAGLVEVCKKYGIQSPRQLTYNDELTIQDIAGYVKYPMIVKVDESEGGYGVFKCRTEADLAALLRNVEHKKNLVFQQMIEGEDINTEALFKNGILMVYNYSRNTKIMKDFGISTQRVFLQNNDLTEVLRKMGADIGLSGFGNIVFMRESKTGNYYLIEIDMRPNSWMYYGKFTGNDFSLAIKNIINNKLELLKSEKQKKELVIGIYKKDVYRCITTKDFKGLFFWILNKKGSWKYIPSYDKKLLQSVNSYLLKTLKVYIANKFRKNKTWD